MGQITSGMSTKGWLPFSRADFPAVGRQLHKPPGERTDADVSWIIRFDRAALAGEQFFRVERTEEYSLVSKGNNLLWMSQLNSIDARIITSCRLQLGNQINNLQQNLLKLHRGVSELN